MPTTDSVSPSAIDRENPWPGLATFTEEQAGLFYGRDAEIRDLTKRAERNPLTVLFGQSGLGKSSLLQAGVFPRLRANSYWPIYIRLDHGPGAPTPTEQIKAMVQADTARAGTWTKPGSAKPGESLWEFFHHRDDRLVSAAGKTIVPVLVFDQFEELFTLGAGGGAERARAVAFMSELAELVENRPSEKLVARLEESSAEMEVFDFSRTDYRVVITLREDFLPHLESLKTTMPALMENRMRLARMTGTQALEAVVKPGGALVTEDVARAIVEFVAGAKGGSIERLAELDVEPPLLSVICRELNERRRKLGQAQITADLVSGNRREILTDFYERSVADLPEGMRTFVEDRLLTKSGFRDNLALETALEEPGVTQALIDTLVARRLLRIEDRIGVQRVELTHDVLAEVIRESRDARQQRLAVEQLHQRERVTRRRMWLARTIAAGLLVGLSGVSWIAWRAIRAEGEQTRLRADADTARARADNLRVEAEAQELAAKRMAYASDMNGVQSALAAENLGRARELLYRHRPAPGEVDLRGWEWRYLWQFCQTDALAVLKKPGDNTVHSIATSADGKWVAAGGFFKGELSLLNLETKEEVRVPAGAGSVHVAFSPRDPVLAIGIMGASRNAASAAGGETAPGTGNRVLLWDVNGRKVLREMPVAGACNGLSFSRDGNVLAVADYGANSAITLWQVSDGSKVASWVGGRPMSGTATNFDTTPDLTLAATISRSGSVSVIDLRTGKEQLSLPVNSAGNVSAIALSPDGRILALSSTSNASIQLRDVVSGRELGLLEGHGVRVGQILFTADGKHLVSAGADQTIRLWDVGKQTLLRTFRGHDTEVWRIALMPDQRTIVSGCKDGSVNLWDLFGGRERSASSQLALRGAWAFAGDGESIVAVDPTGEVTRRQGASFQQETSIMNIGRTAFAIADPKRPLLAGVSPGGSIQVWNWDRRVLVREFGGLTGAQAARPERFSPDGSKLAVRLVSSPGVFSYREWDIETGRETRSFDFPLKSSTRASEGYSSDGRKFLIFPYPSGDGQLFDLQTGRETPLKLTVWEPASRPGFSPDGRLVAVPSLRSSLQIIDTTTNQNVATMRGYMFGVHSAAFFPDGQRIVTGGTEIEAITLWDRKSHERVLTLAARASSLPATSFSPDGNVLVGESRLGGGSVFFWRAPSWAEIEKAEAAERAGAGKL